MSLGRTPLLYEAEPALKYEAGIGNVPAGHWGADPRKKSKPVFSMPLGLSSTDDARTKTTSSWHVKVPQSRSQTQIIRPSIGRQSDVREPTPTSHSRSTSGPGLNPDLGDLASAPTIDKVNKRPKLSLHQKALGAKFPTSYHSDVHWMPPKDAHAELDKLEKTTDKRRLDLTRHAVPGMHHSDDSVRQRAWKLSARNQANSLGGKTDRKTPEPKALVKVLRHRKTGAYSTSTSFPDRPHVPTPKGHDVVHSVMSEWLTRRALLFEAHPAAFFPQQPAIHSDRTVQARMAAAVNAGNQQLADSLKKQLSMRLKLRQDLGGKRKTPESGASTVTTDTQRAAQGTIQRRYRGAQTQEIRPQGHKTQVMTSPPPGTPGGETSITLPNPLRSLDAQPARRRGDTRRLPRQNIVSSLLDRAPLLQELVTAASAGGNPGGAFASGLKPKDPIVSSTPRDWRNLPPTPRKGGAVTTRDVGHTANTGAWVPDKKRREIEIPAPTPIGSSYRSIERDFEDQPSNRGGVLTLVRGRPKLLGG